MRRWLCYVLLLGVACQGGSRSSSGADPITPAAGTDAGTVPVVVEPTVIIFWLAASDTIPVAARAELRQEFLRATRTITGFLKDTDIALLTTGSDTVVVQLAGGTQRMVLLSGLDYPYGYVLIDPGYAEEFHTGLEPDGDFEAAIADYFGLEENDSRVPLPKKHRIAQFFQPGPRTARPGFAPVGIPSRTTSVPFTST